MKKFLILIFFIFTAVASAQTWTFYAPPTNYYGHNWFNYYIENDTVYFGESAGYLVKFIPRTLSTTTQSGFRGIVGSSTTTSDITYDPDSSQVVYMVNAAFSSTYMSKENRYTGYYKQGLSVFLSDQHGFRLATVGHSILGIGWATKVIEKYNPSTDTWSTTGYTLPKYPYTTHVVGKYLYILGSPNTSFYNNYNVTTSDSTTNLNLYRVDSTGAYTDLGQVGTLLSRSNAINDYIDPVSGDTILIFNAWGWSYTSTYGLYGYNITTSTMKYYGHPANSEVSTTLTYSTYRAGGVTANPEKGVIYMAIGAQDRTDTTNSIWAFGVQDSSWRKLPLAHYSLYYLATNYLFWQNDTVAILANPYDSYNTNAYTSVSLNESAAIKDSVPTSFAMTNPIIDPAHPYYTQGDSVMITYVTNYAIDSLAVLINYGNGIDTAKYFIPAYTTGDTTYITLDSVSAGAYIKLLTYPYSMVDSTGTMVITTTKYLHIDTLYVDATPTVPTVAVVTTHYGIDSIDDYIGNTSAVTSPRYLLGSRTVSPSTYITDTTYYNLSYYLTDPWIMSYAGSVDSTIYSGSISRYSTSYGLSPIYNPQICLTWHLYGDGARWIKDVGCGWVSSITRQNGQSNYYVDGDTLKLNYNVVSIVPPYPLTYPIDTVNNFTDSVVILGRAYYVNATHDTVFQYDFTHNVGFAVATLTDVKIWYGMDAIDNKLVILYVPTGYSPGSLGLPRGFMYSVLPTPIPAMPEYYSVKQVLVSTGGGGPGSTLVLHQYRNYFRGIDPKILR